MRLPAIQTSLLVTAAVALALAGPASAQSQLPRPAQLPPAGGPPQGAPPRPAQQQPQQQQQPPQQQAAPAVAPAKPYTPLTITLPGPASDPSFAAFRKQLGEVAAKKDRAGLTRLLVARDFFWEGESGDKADKKKPSFDNLSNALGGLIGKEAPGWDGLAGAALEPSLEAVEIRKGVMCGPALPTVDDKAFEALTKDTGTDAGEWGFPIAEGIEVRAAAQANAPVIDKLGLYLVRVMADDAPAATPQPPSPFMKIVTPSGKVGFVPQESLAPLALDQLCYIKDASGWKITGYIGGE